MSTAYTVVPNDSGGGGTFTPSSVILTPDAPSATFNYTPATTGLKTIRTTNSAGLINPSGLSYNTTAVGFQGTLTVDHTKVSGTQTDFPVLVSFIDVTLKTTGNGGNVRNTNGYDIGFYSDSLLTTPLKWEIERYVPTTGQLVAWVKIPSLSSTVDTVFYIHYGDPSITTDQSDPPNVWTNGFIAVYHFGNGTTLSVADSRGVNNGTNVGGMIVSGGGKIDGAANFNGTSQYVNVGHGSGFDIGGEYTFSAWILNVSPSPDGFIVGKDVAGGRSFAFGPNLALGSKLQLQNAGSATLLGSTAIVQNVVYYVVVTRNVTTDTIYVNAVSDGSVVDVAIPNTATDVTIGARLYAGFQGYWSGWLDEVRFANVGRSTGWVTTEYNNQNTPGTFITVGTLPPVPPPLPLSPLPGSATATQLLDSEPMTRASITALATGTGNFFDSQSFDPCIIVDPTDSTKLIMLFTGMGNPVQTGEQKIGRATASISAPTVWTVSNSGSPVLTATLAYETGGGGVRADTLIYNPGDSKLYLFYTAKESAASATCALASSTDLGLTWTKLGQVLTPSGGEDTCSGCAVLMEGTTLHGIYSYRVSTNLLHYRYASASTSNWLSWTKGGVDIYGDSGRQLEFHHLYKIGSTYLLCYESGGAAVDWDIRFATSSSPSSTFTTSPNTPFFTKSTVAGTFDRYHVATPHVMVINGYYYLIYCGAIDHDQPYGTNHWQMGVVPLGS